MFISRLEAQSFRNLAPLSLHLERAPVVVRGPNAQGKTSFLEALYVCATGRSFRAGLPRELIHHQHESARVAATLSRHGVRHDVEVLLRPKQRLLRVDARSVRHAAALLELVNVVAFFPDDLRIVKGSPEERRRFLDRAIANHRPDFVQASLAYAKVLKTRNSLLRAPGAPDRLLIETYDDELVRHGSIVQACREETLLHLAPLAAARFRDIMHSDYGAHFSLFAGMQGDYDAPFGERFRQALQRGFPRDRARGMTLSGPHRGDLLMQVNEVDARAYASQGQQRALVLALKLAELEYLRGRLGATPVLLLDDVSSELDAERTRALFAAALSFSGQVWVSTTGAAPLPLPADAQIFDVQDGVLQPAK